MSDGSFASTLIDSCTAHNIGYFCLSPGWRSSSLALSVAEKSCDHFIHFDERSLAFHALGYAAVSKKLACVITTSGSAVANLFPAVVEAFYSHIPLIIITADRPVTEKEWGGNQTIDQTNFFGKYVKWHVDLSAQDITASQVSSSVAYASYIAKEQKAPVHINCHLQEPTYPIKLSNTSSFPIFSFTEKKKEIPSFTLNKEKKGLIILGKMNQEDLLPVLSLAKKLNWPVISDILSQSKTKEQIENQIDYSDLMLKELPSPDFILHFGTRVTSKKLFSHIKKGIPYIHVSEEPNLYDPYQKITQKITISISSFCHAVNIEGKDDFNWLLQWKETSAAAQQINQELFNTFPESDSAFFSLLSHYFPEGSALFLGNSMPIRDANNFFHPKRYPFLIYANRGASGIDGNIATAVGLAKGVKRDVIAVIGDLTALHDINALAQMKQADCPITLIIINNQGGSIFSHLPIQSSHHCKKFFQCEHWFSFKHIVEGFGLSYWQTKDLKKVLTEKKRGVVEVKTSTEQSLAFYKQFQEKLKDFQHNKGAIHA